MPTNLIPYELGQRKRILDVFIWIALIASTILGLLNLQYRTWTSVIALFGLALICIPFLILNSKGYFRLAALLFTFTVIIVVNINMYDGDGIYDAGILAYPMIIIFGALFFGKRASPILVFVTIGSLVAIAGLEILGYVHPTIGATHYDTIVPFSILLLVASVITWIIVDTLEKNMERVKASDAELRKNYDLTLSAWAKVLEYRDRETEGHSRRLVELSAKLGSTLGLNEEEMAHLRRGALLHDIGKLAIPDSILLKPGPLDENEIKIIRNHPLYAKQMLSEIPFLQQAISVASCHHEQWDGYGYPEGLKGEDIPLLARIFAVVDNWDALRSERPYRPAWSIEKAAGYIKENSGTKFDPHIVEVFLQIYSDVEVA